MCFVRSRVGSDNTTSTIYFHVIVFQSTLPRGERHCSRRGWRCRLRFQSTLPRGERLFYSTGEAVVQVFQSTLPRGERRSGLNNCLTLDAFQSTLPRGERRVNHTLDLVKVCISIHAPAWGATTRVAHGINIKKYFNPRSRVGSDLFKFSPLIIWYNFNPRSRVGSDSQILSMCG